MQEQSVQWNERESSKIGPNTKKTMIRVLAQRGEKSVKDGEAAEQPC